MNEIRWQGNKAITPMADIAIALERDSLGWGNTQLPVVADDAVVVGAGFWDRALAG